MTLARGAAPTAPVDDDEVESGRGGPGGPARILLLAAWGAVLGAALFVLARRAMPDDALITLSFARNVADHGCWCLAAGIESNTATSPLNVWLLAAIIAVVGHAFWAVAMVLVGSLAMTSVWLHRLGGPAAALLGTAALASSPLLASAVGMETVLAVAVLVGLVRHAADRRPVVSGVLVGAAWLTRPDLVVPAVVAVVVLAVVLRAPRLALAVPLGGLVAAPWAVFSWWHFGSAFANSVTVKWANGAWDGGASSLTSLDYFWGGWPGVTAVTLAAMTAGLVAGVLALRTRQPAAVALAAAGIAHLAALSGNTPPTAYYLGPIYGALACAFVLVAVRWRVGRVLVVTLIVGSVAVLAANGPWWGRGLAPIRQNFATNDQYAAIVRDLPTDGVVLGGEIGALAFYCADRCSVVDPVLSDPGRTDVLVSKWRAGHPTLSAINYHRYRPAPIVPVRYRLHFGVGPQPGAWPITRIQGFDQWAVLEAASDPLRAAN